MPGDCCTPPAPYACVEVFGAPRYYRRLRRNVARRRQPRSESASRIRLIYNAPDPQFLQSYPPLRAGTAGPKPPLANATAFWNAIRFAYPFLLRRFHSASEKYPAPRLKPSPSPAPGSKIIAAIATCASSSSATGSHAIPTCAAPSFTAAWSITSASSDSFPSKPCALSRAGGGLRFPLAL